MQPLGDAELALPAGEMQWCIVIAVGGVKRGACAVQPLGNVEVGAGEVNWLLTIITLRPHARAVRHRCPRRLQVARRHGAEQPNVRVVTSARAGCGGGRRLST